MERDLRDEEEEKQCEQEQRINNNKQRKSNKQGSEQQEERLEVEGSKRVEEEVSIESSKKQQLSNKSARLPAIDEQQQQQQPSTNNQPPQQASIQKLKSKITHRSQSSPSSLTTHKFGLRPTPSPPRLIIDHQTGDIVESYPDHPIYLRTYQPLNISNDETTNTTNTTFNDDITIDESIIHPYPPPLNNFQQLGQYNQLLLAEQYSVAAGRQSGDQTTAGGQQQNFDLDEEEDLQAIMSQQQNRNSFRPVIPPPHSASGKVYFAHPNTTVDHLFNHNKKNHQTQQQHALNQQIAATSSGGNQLTEVDLSSSQSVANALSGSHNNSFKKALNKLNDSNRTDIALITTNDGNEDINSSTSSSSFRKSNNPNRIKVAATDNALMQSAQQLQQKNQILSAKKYQQLNYQQHHRVAPAIEDFKLYDLCYNFRISLVILLSSFIIYLLVVPLNLDCTLYRPTYTYISIIVASVNLICIIIFTLFWYCSGVTRTLYANLSSSAFIITIYSILVAVNLALAILFFFINTCHFHKLISTTKPTTLTLLRDNSEFENLLLDNNNNVETNRSNFNLADRENLVDFDLVSSKDIIRNDGGDKKLFRNLKRSTGEVLNIVEEVNSYGQNNDSDNFIYQHSKSYVTTKIKNLAGYNEMQSGPVKRHRRDDGNNSSGFSVSDNLNKDESEAKINYDEDNGNNNNNGSRENQDSSPSEASQDNSLPPDGGNIMHHPHNYHHHHHNPTTSPFAMSPIEAFWEYLKAQVILFKRSFYRFLTNYDLKFIGALHALCAICLQYMAMKVAVVRSYFCSPVGAYI